MRSEAPDEELILRARRDDSAAIDQLYRRHYQTGHRFAQRLVGHATDADDIAQEAFVKVIGAISRGNGPKDFFRPYLFRAVRTVANDFWDQQGRETPTDEDYETADLTEDSVLTEILRRNQEPVAFNAFKSLPSRWQIALWHSEVENEPPRKVAPLLGITPNALSALLIRARRGLREAYLRNLAGVETRPECEATHPLLASVALGTASTTDRRALAEHTKTCDECTRVLAELTDIGGTMKGIIAPLLVLGMIPTGSPGPVIPTTPRVNLLTAGAVGALLVVTAVASALTLSMVFTGPQPRATPAGASTVATTTQAPSAVLETPTATRRKPSNRATTRKAPNPLTHTPTLEVPAPNYPIPVIPPAPSGTVSTQPTPTIASPTQPTSPQPVRTTKTTTPTVTATPQPTVTSPTPVPSLTPVLPSSLSPSVLVRPRTS